MKHNDACCGGKCPYLPSVLKRQSWDDKIQAIPRGNGKASCQACLTRTTCPLDSEQFVCCCCIVCPEPDFIEIGRSRHGGMNERPSCARTRDCDAPPVCARREFPFCECRH